MKPVLLPEGCRLAPLDRRYARRSFQSGESLVDDWLATKALQHQRKRLSVTKILIDRLDAVLGFYTLATGQVDFGDLPSTLTRRLPRRRLPVAVLAWMGVASASHGQGLGRMLLASALRDCHEAGKTFAFVAVVLDCLNDRAKAFYQRWDFTELPGHANRLFLSAQQLEELMTAE